MSDHSDIVIVIPSERSEPRDLHLLQGDPSTRATRSVGMTNNTKYLTASLLLHFAIILIFTLQLTNSHPQIHYGNSHQQVVSSYLYSSSGLSQPAAQQQQHNIVRQLKHAIALSRIKPKPLTTPNIKSAAAHRKAEVSGQPMPELISLLHAAIQREQQYPASAQEMEREGRVRLVFTLFPDGNINDLRIAQSSGTASLDNAALAAINRALPFKRVDKFIHHPQTYQIDLVFQLS